MDKNLGILHLKTDVMYLLNLMMLSVLGSSIIHMYSSSLLGFFVDLFLFVSFNVSSSKYLNSRASDERFVILQKLSNNYKMFVLLVILNIAMFYLAYFI